MHFEAGIYRDKDQSQYSHLMFGGHSSNIFNEGRGSWEYRLIGKKKKMMEGNKGKGIKGQGRGMMAKCVF